MIRIVVVAVLFSASAALAAPKMETVIVKPNPAQISGDKAPQVEIAISISRTKFDKGGCDARVDFGDGQGRNVDFGVATHRTVHHVYKKGGSYTVAVRGAGATPCAGAQEVALKVTELKKPQPKKKAEPKKKSLKKEESK
jgi:hypothetical protein